jgi:hypothetical protein
MQNKRSHPSQIAQIINAPVAHAGANLLAAGYGSIDIW